MATWSARIASSGNDGGWFEGTFGFTTTSGNVFAGAYFDTNFEGVNTFLRYTNVTIPKNATINSAVVNFTANETKSNNTVNCRIRAVASDNPAAPADYSGAEAATRTSAAVDWSAIPAWTLNSNYDSPDIASVVQEIVNRGGWASGNALVLYFEEWFSTANAGTYRRAYSYDGSTSLCPLLTIDYTVPGSGTPLPVFLHHYRQQGFM